MTIAPEANAYTTEELEAMVGEKINYRLGEATATAELVNVEDD